MISVRGVARAAVVGAMVLLAAGGAAFGQTHAPWPTDWNNWNDPALWVTVGNPGNAGRWSGDNYGGYWPDHIAGAVGYTFNMGKFEVTAGQYTAFLNAVAKYRDDYGLYNPNNMDTEYGCRIKQTGSPGHLSYSVASDWANRPVNFVSWGDAARFANWLTNGQPTGGQNLTTTEDGSYYLNGAYFNWDLQAVTRKTLAQGGRYYIPTEDEWYKAAYYDPNKPGGAGFWNTPLGSGATPSHDLVNPDPGKNANFAVNWPSDVTIGSPYYRTEVGEFENSKSPYGTFDQGGNVWECNEAIILDPGVASYRGMRGGSYANGVAYLYDKLTGKEPTYESMAFGFRVSEFPEPATMSLLALGGLGMLMRRRSVRR
jgi:formylglycine-generating enzyme required for sulfatase activity